jgi:hypothetical protein
VTLEWDQIPDVPDEIEIDLHLPQPPLKGKVLLAGGSGPDLMDCPPGKSPCGNAYNAGVGTYAWLFSGTARNSAFHNFVNDCTNFASQSLSSLGGGLTYMREPYKGDGSWWYPDGTDLSSPIPGQPDAIANQIVPASWINADTLPRHLFQYKLVVLVDSISDVKKGDLIFFDFPPVDGHNDFKHFDHVGMISAFTSNGTPQFAAHTNDRHNIPYDQLKGIIKGSFNKWGTLIVRPHARSANIDSQGKRHGWDEVVQYETFHTN